VTAAFDPLAPRPALEVWRLADDDDVARLVAGLSGFIADSDIERLDRSLLVRARAMRAAGRTYRALCKVEPAAGDGHRQRIEFRCNARTPSVEGRMALEGRVFVVGGRVVGGAVDRLESDGLPPSRDLDLDVRRSETRHAMRAVSATPMRGRLRARARTAMRSSASS
jgi:hypothetical protein